MFHKMTVKTHQLEENKHNLFQSRDFINENGSVLKKEKKPQTYIKINIC